MLNNQSNSYNHPLDYRYIRHIRICRNLSQQQLADKMEINASDLSKLERNEKPFTPYYERKLRDVIRRLRVSRLELSNIRTLLEAKEKRGYK
ncbi:helix-turn-helix domain-containing protein [Priestia megaterium]|uniref:helix-turn-helix domain-containing protein n=1 Tax=Priestia megaterium TaxID=1404 RepID=UPI00372D3746